MTRMTGVALIVGIAAAGAGIRAIVAPQAATQSEQQPKPRKTWPVHTYFRGAPDSLVDMIIKADAVIRGRVVGSAPSDRDLGRIPKGRVMTAARVQILEILHTVGGYPVDPDQIVVLREGGERDKGSYIERVVEEGFPPFENNHEYVLFLRWSPDEQAWFPAYGPDSVFDIQAGRVESPGSGIAVRAQQGKSAADFLSVLRNYGRS